MDLFDVNAFYMILITPASKKNKSLTRPRPLHTFLVIPTFSALLSPTKPFSNNKLKQHRSRAVSLDFPSSAKSRLTLVHLPRVKCFTAA